MKKRKNLGAKIVAFIALAAIIIGIVGTSILFIVNSVSAPSTQNEISQENLNKLLENLPETEASTGSEVSE